MCGFDVIYYATLCLVSRSYAMLSFAMLCLAMLDYAKLRYAMESCDTARYGTLCKAYYAMLCYATPRYACVAGACLRKKETPNWGRAGFIGFRF